MVGKTVCKQTEVGEIPIDWDVKKLGEVTDKIIGGGTPSRGRKEYWNGNIPWVTVKDFATFNPYSTQEYITIEGLRNSSSNLIPKNTIITPTRMGLGRANVYKVDVSINQDLKAIFPSAHIDPSFLLKWFQYSSKNIEKLGSGSTVMGISLTDLRDIVLPIPPYLEQTAIAEALSDMDALITQTEKLIEKKKAIKQGVMQELLKPKEGWVTKKLGDISIIHTGKKNNEEKNDEGAYPFFVRSQNVERINTFSFDGEAILIPGEGNIGKIFHYINGKFDFHQRVYKVSNFPSQVYGKYVYLYLKENFGKYALSNTVKATVDSLRLPTFLEFGVPLPKDFNQQKKIAEIVFDIEDEISRFESKLKKLKLQKQGMMQALLTGKIRLV